MMGNPGFSKSAVETIPFLRPGEKNLASDKMDSVVKNVLRNPCPALKGPYLEL